jgi:hypothetical protein
MRGTYKELLDRVESVFGRARSELRKAQLRLDSGFVVRYLFPMASANASRREQRIAILASPLSELVGFNLTVDCLTPGCGGERADAVAGLVALFGPVTVGKVLTRMRCSAGCGGTVKAAWLETGASINARVRPRRVALKGAEATE